MQSYSQIEIFLILQNASCRAAITPYCGHRTEKDDMKQSKGNIKSRIHISFLLLRTLSSGTQLQQHKRV